VSLRRAARLRARLDHQELAHHPGVLVVEDVAVEHAGQPLVDLLSGVTGLTR
jgi:hypothetical protein